MGEGQTEILRCALNISVLCRRQCEVRAYSAPAAYVLAKEYRVFFAPCRFDSGGKLFYQRMALRVVRTNVFLPRKERFSLLVFRLCGRSPLRANSLAMSYLASPN